LKYGPIERMTGVFVASVAPLGRRTSACRWAVPAGEGEVMVVSDQSASG
jgi:hypothetical protein